MNKSQWIERAAAKSGLSRRRLSEAYDALSEVFEEALLSGEAVQISGFGSFSVRTVEEHIGRDPRTNQPLSVPKGRRVAFVPGKTWKEKMKHET